MLDSRQLKAILSRKYYIAFYIFLLYYFISSLLAFPIGTCINRVYTTIEVVSPFIMYELYANNDKKRKSVLLFVFIAVYVVNFYQMLTTINYSAIAGLRQHEDEEGYLNTGFNFIYSLTLLLTLLVYVVRRNIQNKNINGPVFIAVIIWLLSIVLIVFKSLYTTAIFLMGIGAVIAIFYGRKHWKRKLVIVGAICALMFVYVAPFLEKHLLASDPDYAIISYRIDEISSVLSGGDMDSEASGGARFNRTILSLKTFITHPLFGVNHQTANREIFDAVLIGNHAEWVDSLAEYGVFAFLLFYFLIKSGRMVSDGRGVTVVFILYIIIGFLNPVLYCVQNTICFFIIPMMYDFFLPSDSNKVRQ